MGCNALLVFVFKLDVIGLRRISTPDLPDYSDHIRIAFIYLERREQVAGSDWCKLLSNSSLYRTRFQVLFVAEQAVQVLADCSGRINGVSRPAVTELPLSRNSSHVWSKSLSWEIRSWSGISACTGTTSLYSNSDGRTLGLVKRAMKTKLRLAVPSCHGEHKHHLH